MFSLFKTTSYKTGAALAVAATGFWKITSFVCSILIALYFGAGTQTDIYFYLIMLTGFGVAFMQRLNNVVLIPEAMFLAEEDPYESCRFLTMGFYLYLLLALALCALGLLFPIPIIGAFSRFDITLLKQEQVLLGATFFLFAANLLYYYLLSIAEMHKFFTVAVLSPLNAVCPLLCLLLWGKQLGLLSMIYGFLIANLLQIVLFIWLLHKKLYWDFTPCLTAVHPRAQKNILSGQTLAILDIVNSLLPLYFISGMGTGIISALNYCRQLTDSATEVITNRVANISKIELTENATKGQVNVFNKNFLSTNHLLLFILTPLTVFTAYFALDIIGLFFERGHFTAEAAANTAAFLRPMVFVIILQVPAYLQNNAVSAYRRVKESFPYSLASALLFTAAVWFCLPRWGAFSYPYLLIAGLIWGFAINYFLFKKYFPFVNYFRAFWELLRLLAINIIALVPAAMVRVFMRDETYFLNLLLCGSVYVVVLGVISYKSNDLQLFLKATEINRLFKKLF